MMWGPGYGYGFGMGGGFGMIFMILLVVVVVFLVFGAFRQVHDDRRHNLTRKPRAREILDERYARGEIDAEEYQRKRAEIEQ